MTSYVIRICVQKSGDCTFTAPKVCMKLPKLLLPAPCTRADLIVLFTTSQPHQVATPTKTDKKH